jgi:transposase
MHVKRIKKKDAVYLAQYESYREDGKVKTRFIKYLGKEGDERGVPLPKKSEHTEKPLYPEHSKRAGDVNLMGEIAQKTLNLPRIIDQVCCGEGEINGRSPGKILTAWAINKALNPESGTNLSEWVRTTTIPEIIDLPDDYFTESAFYSSLDRVCFKDTTADGLTDLSHLICDEIYTQWRTQHPLPEVSKEVLAYDLTPVLIFGSGDELGEKGYNSKGVNQKQINLCILVSRWDKIPVSYFLLPGNFNSMSSVKDLLMRLLDLSYEPGTLIWDRGNTSEESIRDIEALGWKLVCGVNKGSNEAKSLLTNTAVPTRVTNRVRSTGTSTLYAARAEGMLFGKENTGVVYINHAKRRDAIDARNTMLAELDDELSLFNEDLEGSTEEEVMKSVDDILGSYKKYFTVKFVQKEKRSAISWNFNEAAIDRAIEMDGKYLLYSTDTSLKATDVVNEYMEKDFIEKVFRTLKSHLKIAPVRHWKNHRIRAIFFVNMMALWLRKVYDHQLNLVPMKKREYGFDELLRRLKRVEYVEVVSSANEKAFWYLNLTDTMKDQLKLMGFKDLFQEKRLGQSGL